MDCYISITCFGNFIFCFGTNMESSIWRTSCGINNRNRYISGSCIRFKYKPI